MLLEIVRVARSTGTRAIERNPRRAKSWCRSRFGRPCDAKKTTDGPLVWKLRPNLGQHLRAFRFHCVQRLWIQPQRLQDGRRDLGGSRGGRDSLCREAWIRHQQYDVGVVMPEPAVIAYHRRAPRICHAYVRRNDNIRRPRILPCTETAHVEVQRQGRAVKELP